MNKELGNLIPTEVSSSFVEHWNPLEPRFIQYFQEQWVPKLSEWVVIYRTHQRANQNTTGAVERWHAILKGHIRSSAFTKTQQTLCWLVILLTEKIELYFWCSFELKLRGRIRNQVVEQQVVTVKAVFLDGLSETEIMHAFGRKCGSSLGGPRQLQHTSVEDAEAPEDPTFHFPFAHNEDNTELGVPNVVNVSTIIEEIKCFDTKVGGDNTFLSHLLIRVKEAVKNVLDMKTKYVTNTKIREDLTSAIASPFVFGEDNNDSNTLARKRVFH
ncbi:hypothetical protein R1sor_017161 [Riccia sorocarpa]|uniref:Protein FAR1-RELATED SEQUENCE n=1 Tax=Riccia sorocarpa TaxID=122646 RepID=A0ABD3IC85_9MARC